MTINTEKIVNPPEKIVLMYQSVSALLREGRNASSLKVQDITARAGIGKGTAYEYFSSKDEIMTYALLYECSQKLLCLETAIAGEGSFQKRIHLIMDWIRDNRQRSDMLKSLAGDCVQEQAVPAEEDPFPVQVGEHVRRMICALMEDARKEGVIREEQEEKCLLTFVSAMAEYAVVIMGPEESPLRKIPEEELRDYILEGILLRLNAA